MPPTNEAAANVHANIGDQEYQNDESCCGSVSRVANVMIGPWLRHGSLSEDIWKEGDYKTTSISAWSFDARKPGDRARFVAASNRKLRQCLCYPNMNTTSPVLILRAGSCWEYFL